MGKEQKYTKLNNTFGRVVAQCILKTQHVSLTETCTHLFKANNKDAKHYLLWK